MIDRLGKGYNRKLFFKGQNPQIPKSESELYFI